MKKLIYFVQKNGLYIFAAGIVLATALINVNVHLYGDDFFYARFSKGDLAYFITRHVDHYQRANGRVIVHLLATLFLKGNLYIWQLVNSLLLGGIVLFGTKTLMDKSNKSNYSALIFAVSIAFLNIDMTRQSVYWLTGSFNYVYPMLMLLIYWYLLSKKSIHKKLAWTLPVMAFLSAATVEQVSLMSFGLTILLIVEQRFMSKQKVERIRLVALLASTLGMLSVVLAPSVFLRASIENAPVKGLWELIKYNIKIQGTTFLFSNAMLPFLLMAMLSALGIVWLYRDKGLFKLQVIDRLIALYGGSALLCWLWQMTSRNAMTNYFHIDRLHFLFFLFIGGGIVLLLLYAGLLVYHNKTVSNATLPLITGILCFGSQAMLLISPVYGPRNLLAAVVMLTLYSAALLPQLNKIGMPIILSGILCFLFNKPWLLPVVMIAVILNLPDSRRAMKNNRGFKIAIALSYICIALLAGNVMKQSIIGYHTNDQVYDENLHVAKNFKAQNEEGVLTQKPLPYEIYAWVMPYQNPYYVPYYNLYLDIKQNSEINWQ